MNDTYEARMSKKYGFSSTDKGLEETQQENPETKEDLLGKDQDSLMIPISAWEAVLGQLGNIHEASQEMAEARERAAKAEAEKIASDFNKDKIHKEKYGKDYKSKGSFLRRYKKVGENFNFAEFYDLVDEHGVNKKLGRYGKTKDGKDFRFINYD